MESSPLHLALISPAWAEFLDEQRQWLMRNPHGDWRQRYSGEFTEEEEKMATRVHIVVAKSKDGHEKILLVCSDYGDAVTKSRNTPRELGSTWVNSYEVEDPVAVDPYRVWVRFENDGPVLRAELCLSIPIRKDVFVPIEPPTQTHGSITVDASSEEEAIAKAKTVLMAYLSGGPVAQQAPTKPYIPRR